jgi:hypothetical protein
MFRALAALPFGLAAALTLGVPHASALAAYRAHWTLDEIGSPTAFDSSGNGNHGSNYNIVGDGKGYTFDGNGARVVVPSSPSLNPGLADFSWGVTLSMTSPPEPPGETYDVLRKGLAGTKGGDYKLEVKNVNGKAVARCVSKSYRANGTKVAAAVQGNTNLADGKQHVLTCAKTSVGIILYVDSLTPRTKTYSGGLGSVSNASNLALGAKAEGSASTGFDWFAGRIYDAWVS